MIEKLKDVSSIIFLPTLVLYLLGFICISSYLSRFGMIDFEILNARFLIAGIIPLISLLGVLYLSWFLYQQIPPAKFFGIEGWKQRWFLHFRFFIFLFLGASGVYLLMEVGTYRAPLTQDTLKFKGMFGAYDFIADQLNRIQIPHSVSITLVVKLILYVYSYLLLIVFFCVAILIIFNWFRKKPMMQKVDVQLSTQDEKTSAKKNKFTISPPIFEYLILVVDLFFVSIYFALGVYSAFKLGTALIDSNTFYHPHGLTISLVVAWAYSSIIGVYLFLFNINPSAEQLLIDFPKYIKNFGTLQLTLQQLVVPILGSLFLFGATIFPLIPFSIGGGEPREVTIQLRDQDNQFTADKMYLLGESDQFLFVVAENNDSSSTKSFEINKSEVAYIQVNSFEKQDDTDFYTF